MKKVIRLTESDLTQIVNRVITEQNAVDKVRQDNYLNPSIATNARNQGAGVYKSNLGYTTTRVLNFGKDKMETGSDEVKKDSPEYKRLVTAMKNTPTPTSSSLETTKKYKVTITGGASAVGTSSGYNNKALAKRRAEKLKQSLLKDVPGLNDKFEITTDGVVGQSTKLNSPEAYAEQFVKVTIDLPQQIADKSFIESDKTITTHGGGLTDNNRKDTVPVPIPVPINDTTTTICVKIPTGYKKALINLLYEFKTDNNIKLTYKESKDKPKYYS